MGYLPIFFDVTGRKCLVVGGGEVAVRKVESLLDGEALVTVVSPRLDDALDALVKRGVITHVNREYRRGDLSGFALVYAATDNPRLHREIAAEAHQLGIMLNVVDVPGLCTFIAPAVVKQGALQIAISTGGASPAFAARLRRELERQFGIEYGLALRIMQAAREYLRSQNPDLAQRSQRLKALAESELPEALRRRDVAAVERIVGACLGDGIGLATLGIDPGSLGLSNGQDASR